MSIRDDIEVMEAGYMEAFNRRDAAACATFYTEVAFYAACGMTPVRGRAAITEMHREAFASGMTILAMTSTDVDVDGGLAFAVETIETDQGKSTALLVYQRQDDSAWRIRAEAEIAA